MAKYHHSRYYNKHIIRRPCSKLYWEIFCKQTKKFILCDIKYLDNEIILRFKFNLNYDGKPMKFMNMQIHIYADFYA